MIEMANMIQLLPRADRLHNLIGAYWLAMHNFDGAKVAKSVKCFGFGMLEFFHFGDIWVGRN